MQPYPRVMRIGECVELADELEHARLHRPALPEPGAVAHVDAIGARVLRDDEQFLHAGSKQTLGFAEHLADRARDEIAAHRRNDAERAAVVAALADLEVGVMARCQDRKSTRLNS